MVVDEVPGKSAATCPTLTHGAHNMVSTIISAYLTWKRSASKSNTMSCASVSSTFSTPNSVCVWMAAWRTNSSGLGCQKYLPTTQLTDRHCIFAAFARHSDPQTDRQTNHSSYVCLSVWLFFICLSVCLLEQSVNRHFLDSLSLSVTCLSHGCLSHVCHISDICQSLSAK